MTYKSNNLLWSVLIYAGLALVGYILGVRQRDGIVSVFSVLYLLQWWLFGGLGLILFILRKFRVLKNPVGLLYVFCGVASLFNAGIEAYLLWTGDPAYATTSLWLQVGVTACLSFLILTGVFL